VLDATFIGDEVTAAAWRLAGMRTRVPEKSALQRVFDEAMGDSDLVVIAANYAALLPPDALRHATRRADPLILVVADGGNRHVPEDLAGRVDRVLGIGA
jgi:vacuolar-type H+-ATPase subunit F/Vma7